MAGKGGARAGAGRKPGGRNRKSREIADRAVAEGVTPLDVMIGTMRELWSRAEALKGKADKEDERLSLMRQASEEGRQCAPYCHPRLAAIEVAGDPDKPIKTESVGERELARRLLFAVSLAEQKPQEEPIH